MPPSKPLNWNLFIWVPLLKLRNDYRESGTYVKACSYWVWNLYTELKKKKTGEWIITFIDPLRSLSIIELVFI